MESTVAVIVAFSCLVLAVIVVVWDGLVLELGEWVEAVYMDLVTKSGGNVEHQEASANAFFVYPLRHPVTSIEYSRERKKKRWKL